MVENKDKIITEALDPRVQEQKMDQWHRGTRGSNIDRMNDDKLEMNFDICRLKGYAGEAFDLEREGKKRGLTRMTNPDPLSVVARRLPMITPSAAVQQQINALNCNPQPTQTAQVQPQQTQQAAQPQMVIDRKGPRPVGRIGLDTIILLEPDELDLEWARFVKDNASNPREIIDMSMIKQGAIRYLISALIFTITLNLDKECLNKLQTFITVNCDVKVPNLKKAIKWVLDDPACCDKIRAIAGELTESLTEEISLDATTPYMLRNDGKLFTCGEAHPYIKQWNTASTEANIDQLRKNESAIDWFIEHSANEETIEMLKWLKENLNSDYSVIAQIFEDISARTNQEFCKVRTSNFKYKYGGDNGEIYFRIDSTNFNWFDLIWNVVNQFRNQIKYVTIMKDEVIRGQKLNFLGFGKYIFNKMPVDEFLTLPGNPVIESLNEDVEKHDELNQKLFDGKKLKQEVKDKINKIVEEFLDGLKEDEITINVKDIVIIGSNVNYNYTKDSDLDVHIIAEHIDAPEDLYDKVYSSYRSLFNKHIDIEFYGIPVELYVQTEDLPTVSNGIYSVMNDEWIKEPVKEDIPEIDKEALDKEFKVWEDRYNKIVDSSEDKLDENLNEDLDDAKSIIADQIRGEWEAVRNYKKASHDLSNINGNFAEVIDILNDISDEEEVHVGELEQAQALMDTELLDNIDDGHNEAQETIEKHQQPEELEDEYVDESLDEAIEVTKNDSIGLKAVWAAANFREFYRKVFADELDAEFKKLKKEAFNRVKTKFECDGNEANNILVKGASIYKKMYESLNEAVENKQLNEIDKFLEDIYELRKTGLASDGEYGIGNLVFKEIRNKGYLDNLKDLKNKLIGKELSLESLKEDWEDNGYRQHVWITLRDDQNPEEVINLLGEPDGQGDWDQGDEFNYVLDYYFDSYDEAREFSDRIPNDYTWDSEELDESLDERLDDRKRHNYRDEIWRISFAQPIIQDNGLFSIYNIKEDDVDRIVNRLRNLDYIEWVNKNASGKYDFSKVVVFGPQPRYYNITGKIKEEI